jgi:succinoglycan biosynthesis protein ExoM
MYQIAICIPTYRRPLLLKKLVLSISKCNIDVSLIKNFTIIIVDNDDCKTAFPVVNELKKELDSLADKIIYVNHPVKGLSNVRNELIRNALLLNPDYIAFVDDDEYVAPEWLNELVKTITVNKADIVLGPVISVFDNNASRYISYWHERQNYPNNTKLDFIRSGNLIIDTKSFLEKNVWFDTRFNSTGAEDVFFGSQMLRKGAKIYWAANAIAYEPVPENRTKLKWLMKRKYNGAAMFTVILKLEKNYLGLLKKVLVNVAYFITGSIALLIVPFPIKKKYWGVVKISESIGGFAGLLNLQLHAYAKSE